MSHWVLIEGKSPASIQVGDIVNKIILTSGINTIMGTSLIPKLKSTIAGDTISYIESSKYFYEGKWNKDTDYYRSNNFEVIIQGHIKESQVQLLAKIIKDKLGINVVKNKDPVKWFSNCLKRTFDRFNNNKSGTGTLEKILIDSISESGIRVSLCFFANDRYTFISTGGLPIYVYGNTYVSSLSPTDPLLPSGLQNLPVKEMVNTIFYFYDNIFSTDLAVSYGLGLPESDIVLPFSGGLESTVCLDYACREYADRKKLCIFVDYGQNNLKAENKAARAIVKHYRELGNDVMLSTIKINYLRNINRSLGIFNSDNAKDVFVPARNLQFMSIMAAVCASRKINHIIVGFNQESISSFTDDTPYFGSMFERMCIGMNIPIRVEMPVQHLCKNEIIQYAKSLKNLPKDLIWFCHFPIESSTGTFKRCGKCKACKYYE